MAHQHIETHICLLNPTHSTFLLRQLTLDRDMAGDADFPTMSFTALRRVATDRPSIEVEQATDLSDIDLDYLSTLKSEYAQADEILAQK